MLEQEFERKSFAKGVYKNASMVYIEFMRTNEWRERHENETLTLATNHRERWTRDEIDFVASFTDDSTDVEIAYALGRSLYAIWAIQYRIRHDGIAAVIARFADDAPHVVTTCPTHHLALTATGDCDWCA